MPEGRVTGTILTAYYFFISLSLTAPMTIISFLDSEALCLECCRISIAGVMQKSVQYGVTPYHPGQSPQLGFLSEHRSVGNNSIPLVSVTGVVVTIVFGKNRGKIIFIHYTQ